MPMPNTKPQFSCREHAMQDSAKHRMTDVEVSAAAAVGGACILH
jgi:hypothetical protein